MIKCFNPSIPNELNKKSPLKGEIFKILHQYVPPLSDLSVLASKNGYFKPGMIFSNEVNLFVNLIYQRTYLQKC